jgi:hypothetical protein
MGIELDYVGLDHLGGGLFEMPMRELARLVDRAASESLPLVEASENIEEMIQELLGEVDPPGKAPIVPETTTPALPPPTTRELPLRGAWEDETWPMLGYGVVGTLLLLGLVWSVSRVCFGLS